MFSMGDLLIRAGCFVAIIILGFVLRKIGFFKDNAFEVLAKVVVKITLPAAIVKNFATSNIDVSMLSIAALGFGGGMLYVVIAYLTHMKKSKEQKAFAVLNLPGYNIGIFALPFVSGFLGPQGVVAACLMDVGNSCVCLGGAYGIASSIKAGAGFSLKRIGKALITSVPFLCYILMLPVALLKLPVPSPIIQCAEIISNGNAFCAMLMIGVGFQLKADKAQIKYVAAMVALRFGVGLLAAAVFYFLLPFSLEVRQALALLAVSPVSSAVPGFTRDLGEDTGLSSAINSVCIVVSIVLMVTMLSVI
jgi:predicted permease